MNKWLTCTAISFLFSLVCAIVDSRIGGAKGFWFYSSMVFFLGTFLCLHVATKEEIVREKSGNLLCRALSHRWKQLHGEYFDQVHYGAYLTQCTRCGKYLDIMENKA